MGEKHSRIALKYTFVGTFFGIKTFSQNFIERYKDICKVIYQGRQYELDHEFVKIITKQEDLYER